MITANTFIHHSPLLSATSVCHFGSPLLPFTVHQFQLLLWLCWTTSVWRILTTKTWTTSRSIPTPNWGHQFLGLKVGISYNKESGSPAGHGSWECHDVQFSSKCDRHIPTRVATHCCSLPEGQGSSWQASWCRRYERYRTEEVEQRNRLEREDDDVSLTIREFKLLIGVI